MHRRGFIVGVLPAIVGTTVVSTALAQNRDRPDVSDNYDVFILDGKKVKGSEARVKWFEHYQKLAEQFANKASDVNLTMERLGRKASAMSGDTLLSMVKERSLWVDAMFCANMCKEEVRRLQEKYDKN